MFILILIVLKSCIYKGHNSANTFQALSAFHLPSPSLAATFLLLFAALQVISHCLEVENRLAGNYTEEGRWQRTGNKKQHWSNTANLCINNINHVDDEDLNYINVQLLLI